MRTKSIHNQKTELIQWISDLNDTSVLHQIKTIKDSKTTKYNRHQDWWYEVHKNEGKTTRDDTSYKHIF